MDYKRTRILPTEVTKNSAGINPPVLQTLNRNDNTADSFPFETKEEYLKFLIERGEIKFSTVRKAVDGKLRFDGHLLIDDRVKSGLDWSDIEISSATVQDGMISKYTYLPCTRHGVKTSLSPKNTEEYIKHNACEAIRKENKFLIKGMFRIPNLANLPNFNMVYADKVLCYYEGKINLSQLPYAKAGFFGIKIENINRQEPELYKTAKAKGLGKNICAELKKEEPKLWRKWVDAFSFDKHN